MMSARRTLIIGGDSSIGSAYADFLRQKKLEVITTSRRGDADAGSMHLDLAASPDQWELPADVDAAVICAAITTGRDCEADPTGTRIINSRAPRDIANLLSARGCFTLLLSTNQVFDGGRAFRSVEDLTSPMTEYGRQKADAETGVLDHAPSAVLRLTKVVAPEAAMFRRWIEELELGKPVIAFTDMMISPVSLNSVLAAIDAVVSNKQSGIHHLSASRDISCFEAAKHIGVNLGVSDDLIVRGTAREAGLDLSIAPAHTTLDASGLARLMNWSAPDPLDALDGGLDYVRSRSPIKGQTKGVFFQTGALKQKKKKSVNGAEEETEC